MPSFRRQVLGLGIVLGSLPLALGGWIWAAYGRRGDYRLSQSRLAPPLLRARFGNGERLYALVRRREVEVLPALSARDPDEGDRLELRAWNATTLEPVFAAPILSVPAGAHPDAGILGEHAATIWLYAGGLGAASAVDGQMLADAIGIRTRNPQLLMPLPESRQAFSFVDGLEFTDGRRVNHRLDPRNFSVRPGRDGPPAGLPPAQVPAPWVAAGVPGLAQLRPDGTWMGLLPAAATGDPRQAALGAGPARLWRALTRAAAATPPPPPPPAVAGKPPAVAAPPPVPQPQTAAIAVEEAPLLDARLLAEVSAPAGVLLLYRVAPQGPWRLARIGTDGAVAWRVALPATTVNALLPGDGVFVLGGTRPAPGPGSAGRTTEILIALTLATGALRARDIATDEPVSV